mmetsp:Transcript_16417/g.29657  ORF Transcript_16417/g.29657 Transcript_16417/m.29657 type:complete len:86 (-) Transcript_16417:1508-1765(-)
MRKDTNSRMAAKGKLVVHPQFSSTAKVRAPDLSPSPRPLFSQLCNSSGFTIDQKMTPAYDQLLNQATKGIFSSLLSDDFVVEVLP